LHFQEKIELEELISLAKSHLKEGVPFVIYRMPNKSVVKGVFQTDATTYLPTPFSESGFVFAPFSSKDKTLWLRPDKTCYAAYISNHRNVGIAKEFPNENGEGHMALVKKAVAEIKKGSLAKVVLSKSIKVAAKVAPTDLFLKAMALYSNAFCYLWFHPETGIWMGASPEQLARTKNGSCYTTALAGTLAQTRSKHPDWTQKEFREQEMVTEYLKAQLEPYLSNITITPRESVLAGKLWHLKTGISGLIKPQNNLNAIIAAIHPTSAVCGLPKQSAMKFILEHEGYERNYYTGYLGEVTAKSMDASIFVNLRCIQILKDEVCIYVGGGITKDSVPQKEWEELVNKSGTMLALL